jgi:hypothetical protein
MAKEEDLLNIGQKIIDLNGRVGGCLDARAVLWLLTAIKTSLPIKNFSFTFSGLYFWVKLKL